ncbi:MAG: MBOAT family protein [Parabacteroides sp.]|nr:MBOAT family protein [Parabacteroides sp.]
MKNWSSNIIALPAFSIAFLLFFPVVCVCYFALPSLKIRNLFLLAASYYFYMNWQPVYALLLLTSTVITYLAARGIGHFEESRKKRFCLVASLVLNLGILFLFKYYNFVAENLVSLLHPLGLAVDFPSFGMLLPVGISFYTFQALGYSIDVYRKNTPVEKDFFTYALFVSFFPQLVAGPIERSTNLLPQFKEKHSFCYEDAMAGFRLMLWGYFLKLILADRCALYVDAVFNNVEHHNGGSFLLASLFFPFQIYGDFAGYSLVAIGVARVLGFRLMENFRRPYFAASVTEFWRRWHISLSTWFKDYVYIPLGGNRVSRSRCYFNVLATFVISGLWHGANWTFLIWGTLHGVLQCVERAFGFHKAHWSGVSRFMHVFVTFCVVSLAWVFFRANSLTDAVVIIKGIFTDLAFPYLRLADFLAIGLALSLLFLKESIDEFGWKIRISESRFGAVRYLYMVAMITYIILFGVLNGDQFIYFQF